VPLPSTACGLDLGSNTFSFTELTVEDGRVSVVNDISLPVRLSEGLTHGGPIKPAAVIRGLRALETLVRDYDLKHKPVIAVATAALRKTGDPGPFLRPAAEILGVEVEVISGKREAELTCKGATLGVDGTGPWIVLDIGGQSTEVCWQSGEGGWTVNSLTLGVVDLTERLICSDPPTPEALEALHREIDESLSANIPRDVGGEVLGVAGTATTLGMMSLGLTSWKREKVHGLSMTKAEVAEWRQRMVAITSDERTERFGVRPVRADVFPAGIAVLERVLNHLGRGRFTISANGLRVGAALSLLD
jgi:exopolyphosphatase/guanosine-5'-triphosphate,3'-diphosphate pyrophosphatase